MNSDVKKYLAEIGRKGGQRKVKKGFAMLTREQIAEACRRSAEARRKKSLTGTGAGAKERAV